MGEPAPQLAQPAGVETAPKPVPLILLVDDDEITRIGMAGRLKRLGHRVIEAVDGSAGLAPIRVHRPDLVILDWMMPGMDGPSVCEAIRADPELRSSQVVLMTAHDRPEQIAEGLSAAIPAWLKAHGVAGGVRILYGGSVKPDNAAAIFAVADVDGGLIGSASLVAADFMAICRAAAGGV